jgi:DNA-binding NtrC family response regulator
MSTKILFVDDEPAMRETLTAILQARGFQVTAAGSVEQALAEIAAQRFAVLICDLNIHQPADGFKVVNAMRAAQPACINLILTGYPALDTAEQAIHSDVDAYITKPVEPEALVLAIQERLQGVHTSS